MTVKQQRPQSAEFSQVKKSKSKKYISNYYFEKDLDKAVVNKEYNYKKCCNDEKGM